MRIRRMVAMRTGVLPRESWSEGTRPPLALGETLPTEALQLHPQRNGFDIPFLMESDSEGIDVWLSQLDDRIGLEIFDPAGQKVAEDLAPRENLLAIRSVRVNQPTVGLWLAHVQQTAGRFDDYRGRLPIEAISRQMGSHCIARFASTVA